MTDYYTAAGVRELDRLVIQEFGIPGIDLMRRAGDKAFENLLRTWPGTKALRIYCGTGNNGGDGFIIGGLAVQRGLRAEIHLAGDPSSLKGDAKRAFQEALDLGVPVVKAGSGGVGKEKDKEKDTVIVDALLGTGLTGEVRPAFRQIIEEINHSGMPVMSVDIPSGLSSDTGEVLGAAVRADLTVTFIGRKIGQLKGQGPRLCGKCVYENLGVPPAVFARVPPIERAAPAPDNEN